MCVCGGGVVLGVIYWPGSHGVIVAVLLAVVIRCFHSGCEGSPASSLLGL